MDTAATNEYTAPQEPTVAPGEYYDDPNQQAAQEEAAQKEQYSIDRALDQLNIAESLDENTRNTIGQRVLEDFNRDKESRSQWEKDYAGWIELAMQTKKQKDFPFVKAANIKYPIVSLAAIQFSARALPAIINNNDFVKGRVIGSDKDGQKAARAARVSEHMNYQLSEEMETWIDEMDELLLIYSIVGTTFKKTYRKDGQNISEMVSAYDLVVNYWAKNLETANRVSHTYELYPNEIRENVLDGRFLDIQIDSQDPLNKPKDKPASDQNDEDRPKEFIEQHCWWDMDGDGYKEPYIVTITNTGQVVRISARFDSKGIKRAEDGTIVKIKPVQYFTQFTFLYSPDGSFYRRGFGSLVGSTNDTINSVINMLLDSGTQNNAGGGFLSSGIQFGRGKDGGPVVFTKINQWIPVNFQGDDLRKAVLPLPTKEPSAVLFQLLGMMIESAKELTSQTDILSGNLDRQEPATTTLARIEQGLKVFSSIYLRIFRSLKKEFDKLFRLNGLYLDYNEYRNILDEENEISRQDYMSEDVGIKPAAAPNSITDAQKMFRAQVIFELRGQGLKDEVIMRKYLEAHNIPDVDELFPQEGEQKPPTADQIELQVRLQGLSLEGEKLALEIRKQEHIELMDQEKMINMRADSLNKIAEAEAKEAGPQLELYQTYLQRMQQLIVAQDQVLQSLGKKYQTTEQGANNNAEQQSQPTDTAGNGNRTDEGGVSAMASQSDNGEDLSAGPTGSV